MPPQALPVVCYLSRLAPGSRRTMAHALRVIARMLGACVDTLEWGQLRYAQTAAIRARVAARYGPATANAALAGLRGVLREAWRLGQMSGEDCQRAVDLPRVRGEQLPRGRALTHEELRRLFGACARDASALGRRDAAVIAVGYVAGLRRSEIVALDLEDYDPSADELCVIGKGRKQRLAYVAGARRPLEDWLAVRGTAEGPLFWPADGRGRPLVNRRLTPEAVACLLRRRARQAGVRPCSPHDLRRTCVTQLLAAGADLAVVGQLVGHATVQTTVVYDRRGTDAARWAAHRLTVPLVESGTRPT